MDTPVLNALRTAVAKAANVPPQHVETTRVVPHAIAVAARGGAGRHALLVGTRVALKLRFATRLEATRACGSWASR